MTASDKPSALRRPICWFRGHKWRVTRAHDSVTFHLGHLHPLAGCDADCDRCGARWRDFAYFDRWPWVDRGDPKEQEIWRRWMAHIEAERPPQ